MNINIVLLTRMYNYIWSGSFTLDPYHQKTIVLIQLLENETNVSKICIAIHFSSVSVVLKTQFTK